MKPTYEELSDRIKKHRANVESEKLREVSIAWSGYLSGLTEWGLLKVADLDALYRLLPELSGDEEPARQIMRGFDYE